MDAIALTFVLLILTWMLYKYLKKREATNVIPGPVGYPLIGCALQLTPDNVYDKFSEFALQFGDIFQIQILQTPHVALNSADLVHKAFLGEGNKHVFNNRPSFFFTDIMFDGGLTVASYKTTDDHVHSRLRKAFTKSLHAYGDGSPKFEQKVKMEVGRFVAEIESYQGKDFDVMSLIRTSLANIMSILLIGETADAAARDDFWGFLQYQDYFLSPITNVILTSFPFLRNSPFYKARYDKVLEIRQRILEKYFIRVKVTRKTGTVRGMVDWYLDYQQEELDNGGEPFMTDEKIMFHILEIITAGMITSTSALSSLILCLLNYPEVQTKMQKEFDDVIGNQREPSLQDRHGCTFAEVVLMETLRYVTAVPFLAPHVAAQDITFEGYTIKQNTMIFPNVYYIHHDEKIWGDPWTFRPERFLDENGEIVPNTHLYRKSWLPFGVGKRQCVGEPLARSRLFLYLSILLQRFTFIPGEAGCPTCDPRKGRFDRNITLRPKPYYCRVIKRDVKID